jgi:hypothetical protein
MSIIKKTSLYASLAILLIMATVTSKNHLKLRKNKLSSSLSNICNLGFVNIGNTVYTSCVNGFVGNDAKVGGEPLLSQLNGGLFPVAPSGWSYGGKAGPSDSVSGDILGLVYNGSTYSFTTTTTQKYEVIISLKAGNGYTPYYFACMSFANMPLSITYSTLGVDNLTGQDLSHMSYYYRPCDQSSSVCTGVSNPTLPAPTPVGAANCTNSGSVETYINGVLTNSAACFGSFLGGNVNNLCDVDNGDNICLNALLNSRSTSVCCVPWCPLEKLDITRSFVVGSFFTISVNTGGKSGTFTITNTNLTFPLLITLKVGNSYSAYLFTAGFTGTWSTTFNELSSATLWGRCPIVTLPAIKNN